MKRLGVITAVLASSSLARASNDPAFDAAQIKVAAATVAAVNAGDVAGFMNQLQVVPLMIDGVEWTDAGCKKQFSGSKKIGVEKMAAFVKCLAGEKLAVDPQMSGRLVYGVGYVMVISGSVDGT